MHRLERISRGETIRTMRRGGRGAMIVPVAFLLAGCVERTLKITSTPSGALVHLNDEQVGRTPLETPYTFYGVYDVRLDAEGHQPLWTKRQLKGPWWEFPGPDLLVEMIPGVHVRREWHFELEPHTQAHSEQLLDRAQSMREQTRADD